MIPLLRPDQNSSCLENHLFSPEGNPFRRGKSWKYSVNVSLPRLANKGEEIFYGEKQVRKRTKVEVPEASKKMKIIKLRAGFVNQCNILGKAPSD